MHSRAGLQALLDLPVPYLPHLLTALDGGAERDVVVVLTVRDPREWYHSRVRGRSRGAGMHAERALLKSPVILKETY
jgi:hypothetical protein